MERKKRTELYELAKKKNIPNRSKMNKAELVAALISAKTPSSTKTATSKKNLVFEFSVDIGYDDDGREPLSITQEKKILSAVKWYKGLAAEQADAEDAKLVSITSEGSKIVIELSDVDTMNQKDKALLMKMIMDPDEDGNHPLIIEKKRYVVTAHGLKVRKE